MATSRNPSRSGTPVATITYPHRRAALTRRDRLRGNLSRTGLTLALGMLWVALSPSLLPRTWWMTAAGVAVSVLLGYVVGAALGRLAALVSRRMWLQVTIGARSDQWLRIGWDVLLVVASVAVWVWSVRQQRQNAVLVGLESGGNLSMALGVLAGVALAAVLLLAGRGALLVSGRVRRLARRWLPRVIAPTAATLVLVLGAVWLTEGVLYRQVANALLSSAAQLNTQTPAGRVQPSEPERSGSAASLQPWETLGRDGRAMVADGPRAADIERVNGEAAQEPIRLYAGVEGAEELQDSADLVLAEMERTGALDRSVLHVTTATGTGYVQEWSVSSVEYLTGGDVATVSMQYSYFSSALAYVSDRTTPPRAGRVLFDTVYEAWSALPADERPMLVVSGESLGSYGGQGAFDSPQDMLDRVDGAVWTGTPRFTTIWSELTDDRRAGSPEIAPVVDNGRNIRFVTRPEELVHDFYGAPYVPWEEPRVVYAQHASDPIVWWEPAMLYREPDWMRERVGRDVPESLRWAPWVSFWQIGADMPLSVSTPGGHGHHYFEDMVPYWAGVLGMDPATDLRAVQDAVRAGFRPR